MYELVRITESRYREVINTVSCVEKTIEEDPRREAVRFMRIRDSFPTVEALKKMEAESRIRDLYPWLIYYRDAYVPDEEDREKYDLTRQYIKKILTEWLDVIPDEAAAPIMETRPRKWGMMDLASRCDVFRELISYYQADEFEGFMKDLGWQAFMRFYKIENKKDYNDCDQLRTDMREVWDKLQSESIL